MADTATDNSNSTSATTTDAGTTEAAKGGNSKATKINVLRGGYNGHPTKKQG